MFAATCLLRSQAGSEGWLKVTPSASKRADKAAASLSCTHKKSTAIRSAHAHVRESHGISHHVHASISNELFGEQLAGSVATAVRGQLRRRTNTQLMLAIVYHRVSQQVATHK